jgi:hypothetical protein
LIKYIIKIEVTGNRSNYPVRCNPRLKLGGARSAIATEPIVSRGGYGKTFMVLTSASVRDETFKEDEGDDEEDLADRWTPRFR